jgi:hypothetical protein
MELAVFALGLVVFALLSFAFGVDSRRPSEHGWWADPR